MKFYMKMFISMLVASCTTTIPTGHARPLTGESSHMANSMLLREASPEQFSASVLRASAEDIISVSSAPEESSGDVFVSSEPIASPMSIAPKASTMIFRPQASPMIIALGPKASTTSISSAEDILSSEFNASPGHISIASDEPSPGHFSTSEEPSPGHVSITSAEPSPGHVSITSDEPSPGHVFIASEEPSAGHVSIAFIPDINSEPDPKPPRFASVPYTV